MIKLVFWHSLQGVVNAVGIDVIQYDVTPKYRPLIGHSSSICIGEEDFFRHFVSPLLMDPSGRNGLRFFLGRQVREADCYIVTRKNYKVFLQAWMVIYRLNKT